MGSAVHLGIAHAILTREKEVSIETVLQNWALQQFPDGAENEVGLVDTAASIARRAINYLRLDRWETILYNGQPLCEQRITIPLDGWDGYVAVMDWVARDLETGYIWLIDHKVRSKFLPDESEEINAQMASYQYVLKYIGVPNVKGSMCFQIRDQLPLTPAINKDGSISRMRILTDWPTYQQTVVEAGEDPANYVEMMAKLSDVEFFKMIPAFRADREVQGIWDQIVVPTAGAIKQKRDHYIRSLGTFNCNGCEFRTLCLEDLRGNDTTYILERDFQQPGERSRSVASVEMIPDL
jgi:hypothetical protein